MNVLQILTFRGFCTHDKTQITTKPYILNQEKIRLCETFACGLKWSKGYNSGSPPVYLVWERSSHSVRRILCHLT